MAPARAAVSAIALWLSACGQGAFFTPISSMSAKAVHGRYSAAGTSAWFTATAYGRFNTQLLGTAVRFDVEPGVSIDAQRLRIAQRSADDYTWFGKTPQGGTIVLVVRNGEISGTVHTAAATYRIVPQGQGQHVIVRLPNHLPKHHPPSFRTVEQTIQSLPPAPAPRPDSPPTIELIFEYTRKARAACPNVENEIQGAVEETTQISQQSGANITFHLAEAFENSDGYVETGSMDTDLDFFRTNHDHELDDIHDHRDRTNADIAILVVDSDESYLGTAAVIGATPDTAFTVVACQYLTGFTVPAHEIGHVIGLRHNPEDDPGVPIEYGHGYRYPETEDPPQWATVMVPDCNDGCERLWQWSTPTLQHDGRRTGTPDRSNDARAIAEQAETVSRFRPK